MKNRGFVKGTSIMIVELASGKRYALGGWNGEEFHDCWEVDESGIAVDVKSPAMVATPIYKQISDDEYEIIDYEIN